MHVEGVLARVLAQRRALLGERLERRGQAPGLLDAQRRDARVAVGGEHDEALGRETAQRLAQWRDADPDPGGERDLLAQEGVGVAAPVAGREPLLLDMATLEAVMGKIRRAARTAALAEGVLASRTARRRPRRPARAARGRARRKRAAWASRSSGIVLAELERGAADVGVELPERPASGALAGAAAVDGPSA